MFETDDIFNLHERLSTQSVRFTRGPTKTPWGGMIADFLDPDWNEIEVVQDARHDDQGFPPEGKTSIRE